MEYDLKATLTELKKGHEKLMRRNEAPWYGGFEWYNHGEYLKTLIHAALVAKYIENPNQKKICIICHEQKGMRYGTYSTPETNFYMKGSTLDNLCEKIAKDGITVEVESKCTRFILDIDSGIHLPYFNSSEIVFSIAASRTCWNATKREFLDGKRYLDRLIKAALISECIKDFSKSCYDVKFIRRGDGTYSTPEKDFFISKDLMESEIMTLKKEGFGIVHKRGSNTVSVEST